MDTNNKCHDPQSKEWNRKNATGSACLKFTIIFTATLRLINECIQFFTLSHKRTESSVTISVLIYVI